MPARECIPLSWIALNPTVQTSRFAENFALTLHTSQTTTTFSGAVQRDTDIFPLAPGVNDNYEV
jgi:hypothetical protein